MAGGGWQNKSPDPAGPAPRPVIEWITDLRPAVEPGLPAQASAKEDTSTEPPGMRAAHRSTRTVPGPRKDAGPRQWPTRPPRPAPLRSPPRAPVATSYHRRRSALRAYSLSLPCPPVVANGPRGNLPCGILPIVPTFTPEGVTKKGTTSPPLTRAD